MIESNSEALSTFERVTNYPIKNLLVDFVNFMENDYSFVVGYYSGNFKTPNIYSFNKLYSLIKESYNCLEAFQLNKNYFNNIVYWNLLEQVEDINSKLQTISNINFYLRSYLNKNQFSQGSEVQVSMGQFGTLEKVVSKELNSSNPNDDWIDLALYNLLTEEGYKAKEGTILRIFFPQNTEGYFLNSVLGPLKGELLYGIDINEKLTFVDNDLLIDSPKETMLSAINRYLNLKMGDNPEFPNDGIQVSLFVGNNIGSLLFPVLFRQQTNVFKKDDTIASFSITNLKYEQGGVFIDYEIQTKFGEIYSEKQKLII